MYALSLTLSSVTPGCTNPGADNYDAAATVDDGSCTFPTPTPSPSLAAGVSATLALDMDINTIPGGSPERASFESSFRADVAAQLGGISADRIVILSIQGSVTVDFAVLPADDGSALDPSVVASTFAASGVSVAGSATTSAVSNIVSTTPAPAPSPSPAPAPTPPPSPPPGPVPQNSKSQAAAAGQPVPKIYKGAVRPALSPSLLLHRHSQAVASTCHAVVGVPQLQH